MITYKKKAYTYSIVAEASAINMVKIKHSDDINKFMRKIISNSDIVTTEQFYILCLNRRNNTMGYRKISQGGISSTLVDPKVVFKYAIESMASAIILIHNHPSGHNKPGQADISLTKRLIEIGELLDLPILDHIILTDTDYYSFTDEGLMHK